MEYICDEIREVYEDKIDYSEMIHYLFKSEESESFLALAYITGILVLRKMKLENCVKNMRWILNQRKRCTMDI